MIVFFYIWRGMELEIIVGITSAVSIVGTVFIQWMRRDTTESEADVNIGQSAKFWADAMNTMSITAARATSDSQELLRTLKDTLVEMGGIQRDIWALKGENQRSAEREIVLTAQVETLMKSKLAMEKASLEKDKQIAVMQEQIATIPAMQEKISTLEKERVSLLATVDEMSKRLEASESSGDNGKTDELPAKTAEITAKNKADETTIEPIETK